MKKVMYSIAIMTAMILTSCGGQNKTEEHNHEGHDHTTLENHSQIGVIPTTATSVVDAYLAVKEGLVSDDAVSTAKSALALIGSLDNISKVGYSDVELGEINEIIGEHKKVWGI